MARAYLLFYRSINFFTVQSLKDANYVRFSNVEGEVYIYLYICDKKFSGVHFVNYNLIAYKCKLFIKMFLYKETVVSQFFPNIY